MTDAKRDGNYVPTIIVPSDADGSTILNIKVDPGSHGIVMDDNTTGTDFPRATFKRDNNSVPVIGGVSSSDGKTPVAIYGKVANGALLVNSS